MSAETRFQHKGMPYGNECFLEVSSLLISLLMVVDSPTRELWPQDIAPRARLYVLW